MGKPNQNSKYMKETGYSIDGGQLLNRWRTVTKYMEDSYSIDGGQLLNRWRTVTL